MKYLRFFTTSILVVCIWFVSLSAPSFSLGWQGPTEKVKIDFISTSYADDHEDDAQDEALQGVTEDPEEVTTEIIEGECISGNCDDQASNVEEPTEDDALEELDDASSGLGWNIADSWTSIILLFVASFIGLTMSLRCFMLPSVKCNAQSIFTGIASLILILGEFVQIAVLRNAKDDLTYSDEELEGRQTWCKAVDAGEDLSVIEKPRDLQEFEENGDTEKVESYCSQFNELDKLLEIFNTNFKMQLALAITRGAAGVTYLIVAIIEYVADAIELAKLPTVAALEKLQTGRIVAAMSAFSGIIPVKASEDTSMCSACATATVGACGAYCAPAAAANATALTAAVTACNTELGAVIAAEESQDAARAAVESMLRMHNNGLVTATFSTGGVATLASPSAVWSNEYAVALASLNSMANVNLTALGTAITACGAAVVTPLMLDATIPPPGGALVGALKPSKLTYDAIMANLLELQTELTDEAAAAAVSTAEYTPGYYSQFSLKLSFSTGFNPPNPLCIAFRCANRRSNFQLNFDLTSGAGAFNLLEEDSYYVLSPESKINSNSLESFLNLILSKSYATDVKGGQDAAKALKGMLSVFGGVVAIGELTTTARFADAFYKTHTLRGIWLTVLAGLSIFGSVNAALAAKQLKDQADKIDGILTQAEAIDVESALANASAGSVTAANQVGAGFESAADLDFNVPLASKAPCVAGKGDGRGGCATVGTSLASTLSQLKLGALAGIANDAQQLGNSLQGQNQITAGQLKQAEKISNARGKVQSIMDKVKLKLNEALKSTGAKPIDFDKAEKGLGSGLINATKSFLASKGLTAKDLVMNSDKVAAVKPSKEDNDLLNELKKRKAAAGKGVEAPKDFMGGMKFNFKKKKDEIDLGDEGAGAISNLDIKMDDINKNSSGDIFKMITTRYLKSAYSSLLEEDKEEE